MNLPQPDMYTDWKSWAAAVVTAFLGQSETQTLQVYGDYADDTAAATAGVPVGGYYRTGSVLKVRVT